MGSVKRAWRGWLVLAILSIALILAVAGRGGGEVNAAVARSSSATAATPAASGTVVIRNLDGGKYRSMVPIVFQAYLVPFFDDFTNPNSGWPILETSIGSWSYDNGEYHMVVKQPNYVLYAGNSPLYASDFNVAVGARTDTPSTDSYGLYFGYNNGQGRYVFDVAPGTGMFQLYRRDYAQNTVTQLWYSTFSGSIRQGTATNRLQVTRSGTTISLLVNGQQVAQVSDGTYGAGYVGLETTGSSANAEAFFDKFGLAFSATGTIPTAYAQRILPTWAGGTRPGSSAEAASDPALPH